MLVGWATVSAAGAPDLTAAEHIVVFEDGVYRTLFRPRLERSDGPTAGLAAGFRYRLPPPEYEALAQGRIEIYAVAGESAAKLELTEAAKRLASELTPAKPGATR